MGLSARLARYAAAAPRPFIVDVPGGARARTLVDGESRRRGWFQADAPAAADLLVVCGDPGAELAEAIDTAWADVPGPRARVSLPSSTSQAAIREALDRAMAELADITAQRDHAMSRAADGPWRPENGRDAHGHGPHGHDQQRQEQHGHDQHGHEQHGHEQHGRDQQSHDQHAMHGEHMMGAPAGLAMAGRAPDRDGLKLDVLHVPLGPVLRDWPAGLRVMLTLQGDVVQAAEVHVAAGARHDVERFWDEPWLAAAAGGTVTRGAAERRRAAAHLDSLARFLGVAGWRDQADRACVLRDAVLAGTRGEGFERFARRTERSRLLRWMVRGIGAIDQTTVARYGLTGPAARRPGDVETRVKGWLAGIRGSLAGMEDPSPLGDDEGPRGPVGREPGAGTLAALPSLLVGEELAAARLIVASLDPDTTQVGAMADG